MFCSALAPAPSARTVSGSRSGSPSSSVRSPSSVVVAVEVPVVLRERQRVAALEQSQLEAAAGVGRPVRVAVDRHERAGDRRAGVVAQRRSTAARAPLQHDLRSAAGELESGRQVVGAGRRDGAPRAGVRGGAGEAREGHAAVAAGRPAQLTAAQLARHRPDRPRQPQQRRDDGGAGDRRALRVDDLDDGRRARRQSQRLLAILRTELERVAGEGPAGSAVDPVDVQRARADWRLPARSRRCRRRRRSSRLAATAPRRSAARRRRACRPSGSRRGRHGPSPRPGRRRSRASARGRRSSRSRVTAARSPRRTRTARSGRARGRSARRPRR